jgi:hypothetical protein
MIGDRGRVDGDFFNVLAVDQHPEKEKEIHFGMADSERTFKIWGSHSFPRSSIFATPFIP